MQDENDVFVAPTAEEHPMIERFKQVSRRHDLLVQCFDKVLRLSSRSGTSGVVIVTGPSGSGKTHLARKLYAELRRRYQALGQANPALAPVVGIRAVPPRATAFDWQDFFIRFLEKLGDCLAEKKLLVPVQLSWLAEVPVTSPAETMKVTALRRSVEKALRSRKTRVLIVDEAHHILMSKDPDLQRFVFEQLKSLTDETGIILVLVGTYDLLDIRDYSGQLMRRSDIVHLSRYDYANKDHLSSFTRVFQSLANALPISPDPGVRADKDLFYRKSAGCVGILRDLLLECLRQAIEDDRKVIDRAMVGESAKSNQALRTILAEAIAGEDRLIDITDDEVRQFLLTRGDQPESSGAASAEVSDLPPSPAKRTGRARPGQRHPVRDRVGAG